jgi:hypothetical protein
LIISNGIACGMGGCVVGESYKLYEGNVTPVVLEKEDYVHRKEL